MGLKKKATVLIFVTVILMLRMWNLSRTPLDKTVTACWKYALPCWQFDYVLESEEKKHIKIVYKQSAWSEADKQTMCTKNVVTALYEKLLFEPASPYHDYVIDIHFSIVNGAETLEVHNMTAELDSVQIHNGMTSVSLQDIVDCFPYAKELFVDGVNYHDTIRQIKGFDDLQHFSIGLYLSEEEKEYIYSIYPNCVVEDLEE